VPPVLFDTIVIAARTPGPDCMRWGYEEFGVIGDDGLVRRATRFHRLSDRTVCGPVEDVHGFLACSARSHRSLWSMSTTFVRANNHTHPQRPRCPRADWSHQGDKGLTTGPCALCLPQKSKSALVQSAPPRDRVRRQRRAVREGAFADPCQHRRQRHRHEGGTFPERGVLDIFSTTGRRALVIEARKLDLHKGCT
jgi:hypothetical protein